MRRRVLAVAIIVAVVLGSVAEYAIIILSSGANSTTACTGSACTPCPTVEGTLFLKVLNSSTDMGIGSVDVQISDLYPECSMSATQVDQDIYTGANGTVTFRGLGEYHIGVYHSGQYSAWAGIGTAEITCVTVSIPSGKTQVWFTGLSNPTCK